MANALDKTAVLRENLSDAGCAPETAEQVTVLLGKGEIEAASRVLAEQRRALLRQVHDSQHKIDCLDYLAHSINKNTRG